MNRRNNCPALQRAGFTLIELTLVTFLLLTLVGLSIPLFKKTFSNFSARDTSFNISKLINYAQEMAVLERKNFKIAFNFEKGAYQLFESDIMSKEPVYKRTSGRFGRLFGIPQGLKLTGDKKDMIFYPDGHCDAIKVNILSKESRYSVVVKNFGNMVDIKEVALEQ